MMRENKAWIFKEVDSPLFDWEPYADKTKFYQEVGIALVAGATQSIKAAKPVDELPFAKSTLSHALDAFLKNSDDLRAAKENFISSYGEDDPNALNEALSKVVKEKRLAAGYLEGFQATVTAIKANEAIVSGQRIALQPEWFELG